MVILNFLLPKAPSWENIAVLCTFGNGKNEQFPTNIMVLCTFYNPKKDVGNGQSLKLAASYLLKNCTILQTKNYKTYNNGKLQTFTTQ